MPDQPDRDQPGRSHFFFQRPIGVSSEKRQTARLPIVRRLCSNFAATTGIRFTPSIRRGGYSPEEAEDLTQGFFTELLAKNFLGQADRQRGRFRTFLLAAVKHYLANEWDREHAQKRGGQYRTVSFDFQTAERVFCEAASNTPDKIYLEHWSWSLLNRVILQLQAEISAQGHPERIDKLRSLLTANVRGTTYRDVAGTLGMSEGAVKVAVRRMRRRFGHLLRAEIRKTVSTDAEVDEEIRFLFSAVEP